MSDYKHDPCVGETKSVTRQRQSEPQFLGAVHSHRPVVNGITVAKVGRFLPGDASSYSAAFVIGDRGEDYGEQRYSTHMLIWNDHVGQWVMQTGHYDLTWTDALTDLAGR